MVEIFEILKKHTFLEYAIRHWFYHARLAEITSRTSQHELLKALGIRNRLHFRRILTQALQCRHSSTNMPKLISKGLPKTSRKAPGAALT